MNRIETIQAASKYAREAHAIICIDGIPFDELVHRAAPSRLPLGLVPTLLDWLCDPVERTLVRGRILPPVGKPSRAPILMCPDDCDLLCTVVVAEVVNHDTAVCWNQIGIDSSDPEDTPFSVGTTVDWLNDIGPFYFSHTDYQQFIAAFGVIVAS